jgi:hypothetical protein
MRDAWLRLPMLNEFALLLRSSRGAPCSAASLSLIAMLASPAPAMSLAVLVPRWGAPCSAAWLCERCGGPS